MGSVHMRARVLQRAVCGVAITTGILGSAPELSQAANPADANERMDESQVAEVVVTRTRRTGLTAADSPTPIQVLGASALSQTGAPDLMQSMVQNVPSLITNEGAFAVDTAELTYSVKLRGLSPNDALVLVNGKRRHTTANLAVAGGPFQGSAAADF